MFTLIPLVLVIVLVGSFIWWSRNRHLVASVPRAAKGKPEVLPPELQRWLTAGLVSKEQATAIVTFEENRVPTRKIPLFAEALGYIGAVLALAGGGVGIGQVWEDLSDLQHVGILAAAGVTAFVAGWLIRRQSEPAIARLMSVLWTLSVGGITAAAAIYFVEVAEIAEDARVMVVGGCGALYAVVLWRLHTEILQQVAVFATGLATVVGITIAVPGEAADWSFAVVVWAYGAAWLALGWFEFAVPPWSALALGAVVGAYGPSIMAEDFHGWLLGLGLATGAALMALSISGRRLPLLGVGGIASFGYLTALVVHYFGDALGIPMALAIVGVVVLALAVIMGRSGVFGGTGWRHPPVHPAT